ncbi:thermonuclease family protein [Aquipuribacter sp. MA13-6]|uniref:thermonuclease family protein n=1 Tax=unclassified Aquipuribacter TaxID=2635084 RepID=UPI003EEAE28A
MRRGRRRVLRVGVLLVGSALVAATAAGCGGPDLDEPFASVEAQATTDVSSVPVPDGGQPVTVERVVDGDTLLVSGDAGTVLPAAGEHRVRLLLVDTPEVDGPNATQECLGPEASAFAADLLPAGSTVVLAADEETVDQFDRLLAYAWTPDGVFVNEALAANGFAYSVLIPPNDEHAAAVIAAEQRARDARLGVWGSC